MRFENNSCKEVPLLIIEWDVTRQVCNLFQEPVEQPLLGFRIAEEKWDRLNVLKNIVAFGAAKSTLKVEC